ncbi:hypothetical protein FACS1894200_12790 [Spirochaetia bacterium]|nr:hypothetical protein FACS1894200_12790 [Spirochaetia bacterium]
MGRGVKLLNNYIQDLVPAILSKAKTIEGKESDVFKICKAVCELYPKDVELCKKIEGYTPAYLRDYVMGEVLDWANMNDRELFKAISSEYKEL